MWDIAYETMEDYRARIRELKEENKRVKERADDNKSELRKEIKHLNEMIYKFEEENRKLKLHIEAKDKAYTTLLKEYEEYRYNVQKIFKKYEEQEKNWLDDLDNVIMNR